MVKIRLHRTGTTKRPLYRIVAIDSRRKRQGRVLQRLGTYDPVGGGGVTLDLISVDQWLGKGAQLSDTVNTLVKRYRKQAASEGPVAANAPGDAEAAPAAS